MSTRTSHPLAQVASETADQMAEKLASKAHGAVSSARRRANGALNSIDSSVDHVRDAAPSAFSRTAIRMESLSRRGLERARDAGHQMRDQARRASDRAVGYIRHEPVKSMLIAVAAGAAVTMLTGWFARSRAGRL